MNRSLSSLHAHSPLPGTVAPRGEMGFVVCWLYQLLNKMAEILWNQLLQHLLCYKLDHTLLFVFTNASEIVTLWSPDHLVAGETDTSHQCQNRPAGGRCLFDCIIIITVIYISHCLTFILKISQPMLHLWELYLWVLSIWNQIKFCWSHMVSRCYCECSVMLVHLVPTVQQYLSSNLTIPQQLPNTHKCNGMNKNMYISNIWMSDGWMA